MGTQDEVFRPEMMGKQLKKLRNSLNLSQDRFAERMNLSRETICNYERGKTAIPHDLIKSLCHEFNVSADYFYFEEDKPLADGNAAKPPDLFYREMGSCTELEKQQLMEMLKILRMKPVAV